MTGGRAYKPAISSDEAIAELKRCSGSQFDPVLVDKFAEILSEQKT
jgi:HD-GYP domain-containing protein (c-di-GMP phosphodiesterase class II)